jgi:hypothetical protein
MVSSGKLSQARTVIAYAPELVDSVIAFIISSNAARRQMTKGALAMVVATQYPTPEDVGRGKKGVVATQFAMVSKDKLSHARTVLAYSRELALAVLTGPKSSTKRLPRSRRLAIRCGQRKG